MASAPPTNQKMTDRGCNDACAAALDNSQSINIHQMRQNHVTREIKYKVLNVSDGGEEQLAELAGGDRLRPCFPPSCWQEYHLELKNASEEELFTIDMPKQWSAMPGKCCGGYQQATVTSGGTKVGRIEEQFYCCVPRFNIYDGSDEHLYTAQPPTCFGGWCVDCCSEGIRRKPYHLYTADIGNEQMDRSEDAADAVGKITEVPRGSWDEFTSIMIATQIDFPKESNADTKTALAGAGFYFTNLWYKKHQSAGAAAGAGAF